MAKYPDPFAPLGAAEGAQPAAYRPAARARVDGPATLHLARTLWRESVSAVGTIVENYLRSRGLDLPCQAPLRFHGSCPRDKERLPAMVALMTDPVTAKPVGVHRTFLRPDGSGKADGQAKMMLGGAGIIRLVADEEVTVGLGLAEGIETALSVAQHGRWAPVWAAGTAGSVAAFPVLPGIEALTVFADADEAGTKAARACALRWRQAGGEVTIHRPRSGDWNDAARAAA